jgi:hypothetical protein
MRVAFLELRGWLEDKGREITHTPNSLTRLNGHASDLSNMQINCSKPRFVLDLSCVVSAGLEAILPMKGSDEQS